MLKKYIERIVEAKLEAGKQRYVKDIAFTLINLLKEVYTTKDWRSPHRLGLDCCGDYEVKCKLDAAYDDLCTVLLEQCSSTYEKKLDEKLGKIAKHQEEMRNFKKWCQSEPFLLEIVERINNAQVKSK